MLIPPAESNNVKCNFPFSFPMFFNSFWNFDFLKNAKDEKSNMLWKSKKIKWRIFGKGENRKNANGGKM
jgi:hypothetical protein